MFRNGYKVLYNPSHHRADSSGMVYEHIIEAEKIVNRPLKKCEVVHHEDGNKSNNKLENLFVFRTIQDHSSYHNGGTLVKHSDKTYSTKRVVNYKECKNCKKMFRFKQSKSKFCNLICYNQYKSRLIPPKELLIELLKHNSFVKVGKMFNVSDNAVRKWCTKYDIPKKASFYKNNDL